MSIVQTQAQPQQVTETNTLRIFGCGGTGANLISQFVTDQQRQPKPGYAKIDAVVLDTSRSNLLRNTDMDKVFLFDKTDGSGKIRAENHKQIASQINQILVRHEAKEMNMVIFSTSGGSGSVIGPLIARELLSRDAMTVLCCVVTEESAIAAENSRKTIATLDQIAKQLGKPVVTHFVTENTRQAADEKVKAFIEDISLLVSNQHLELDNRDLHNFFGYHIPTRLPAELAEIDVYATRTAKIDQPESVFAVAELHPDTNVSVGLVPSPYSCVGYPRFMSSEDSYSYYYVIGNNGIESLVDELLEKEQLSHRQAQARVVINTTRQDDKVEDSGLVL